MKETIQTILQPDGTLRCSRCGGVRFEAKRSFGMKVAFGLASLLAQANEIHCLACGQKYRRGVPGFPDPAPARPDQVAGS